MAHNEPIRPTRSNSDIPDKLYFRIGDVAKLCEVPAYVLRFWESEFPQLKPNKGGTGQRLYRRKDVEMALRIKRLLYDEGYTIPGARQIFKQEQRATPVPGPQLALAIEPSAGAPTRDVRRLRMLRKELQELYGLLAGPVMESGTPALQVVRTVRPPRPMHGLALASKNSTAGMDDLFSSPTSLVSPSTKDSNEE